MADGNFASKVSATRDANLVANPIFVRLTDGTTAIGVTGNALDINITNATVAVTQSGTWNIATVTTLTGITNDVNIADGGNSITVDAVQLDIDDLNATDDNVAISDGTDTLAVNTDGSINVNVVSAALSDEFQDYSTATPAADASSNLDYTVSNTTGLLTSVILSSSGDTKFTLQAGPIASLATKAVIFLNGKEGDTKQINFNPALEATGTTPTFRIIAFNRENQSNDVYATFVGRDI